MTGLITRSDVIDTLERYLQHRLSQAELVDWAEDVMMAGELDPDDHDLLRDVVARLGVADVKAFGLTWDDCEEIVERLGYRAQVTLAPA